MLTKTIVSVGLLPCGVAIAVPLYQVTFINTLGTPSSVADNINNSGVIVGTTHVAQGGFIYSNGVMNPLFSPDGGYTYPLAINNAGQIVGGYDIGTGGSVSSTGFLYTNGTFETISAPGAYTTSPTAINNEGVVAGTYAVVQGTGDALHFFTYRNGTLTDLGVYGSTGFASVTGINDSNQIVGDTAGQAFIYSNGVLTELGSLRTTDNRTSYATAINDAGDVVGQSEINGIAGADAFLYSNGTMQDLGTLGGIQSVARAINSSGEIVGQSTLLPDDQTDFHAFLSYCQKSWMTAEV